MIPRLYGDHMRHLLPGIVTCRPRYTTYGLGQIVTTSIFYRKMKERKKFLEDLTFVIL